MYIKGIDLFCFVYIKVDYKLFVYLFCILLKVEIFLENIYFLNLKMIRGVEVM